MQLTGNRSLACERKLNLVHSIDAFICHLQVVLGQRKDISAIDPQQMNRLYKCPGVGG